MRVLSIRDFATECDCTYEAIRQRIEKGSIDLFTTHPKTVDADEYADLIKYLRLKALHKTNKK